MGAHVFPGAVLESAHDGTLATIDAGKIRSCSRCEGGHIHRLLSPDENPDGSFGPDVHFACCSCGYVPEEPASGVSREWI